MDSQQKDALRKLANIENLEEQAVPSTLLREARELVAIWSKNKRGVEEALKVFIREDRKRSEIAVDFIQDAVLRVEDLEAERKPSVRRGSQGF